MRYNYRLAQEAEQDIYEAYRWYEKETKGLGKKFLKALEKALENIVKNPLAYGIRHKEIRGFPLKKFPYLLLYIINSSNIDVIAVFHTNKNPDTWQKRAE